MSDPSPDMAAIARVATYLAEQIKADQRSGDTQRGGWRTTREIADDFGQSITTARAALEAAHLSGLCACRRLWGIYRWRLIVEPLT